MWLEHYVVFCTRAEKETFLTVWLNTNLKEKLCKLLKCRHTHSAVVMLKHVSFMNALGCVLLLCNEILLRHFFVAWLALWEKNV